mmetsp:Transcript_70910/g.140684  ORF Transcript_70910/g.140684 Transcript_70910/m.140684 type:complete len:224 (-) Transcript_70910:125-796(-)
MRSDSLAMRNAVLMSGEESHHLSKNRERHARRKQRLGAGPVAAATLAASVLLGTFVLLLTGAQQRKAIQATTAVTGQLIAENEVSNTTEVTNRSAIDPDKYDQALVIVDVNASTDKSTHQMSVKKCDFVWVSQHNHHKSGYSWVFTHETYGYVPDSALLHAKMKWVWRDWTKEDRETHKHAMSVKRGQRVWVKDTSHAHWTYGYTCDSEGWVPNWTFEAKALS